MLKTPKWKSVDGSAWAGPSDCIRVWSAGSGVEGAETLTATTVRNCNALAVHQVFREQGSFSPCEI